MKVILLQEVKGQGKSGQTVDVSDGYARNFLFPKKLAVEANATNMNSFKGKADAVAFKKQTEEDAAKELAKSLEEVTVRLSAKGGTSERLFGSVTAKEITQQLKEQHGLEIDKRKMVLEDGIKTFGAHEIMIKLYPQISAKIKVEVTKE